MTNAELRTVPSRWVENDVITLKSYGIALCAVIAFLLFAFAPSRQHVLVNKPVVPSTVANIIQKIHLQLPQSQASGGSAHSGQRVVGEAGKPKPVFQLVVPNEPDLSVKDPIDWSPGDIGSQTVGNAPGSGTNPVGNHPSATNDSNILPDDEPFVAYEQDPSFSMDALRRAVRYPDVALRMQIEGRVIVRAYVNSDGSLSNVSVLTSDNPLLDEAAINGVRKIQYQPAQQNGRATGCWIYIPVSFELSK